VTARSSCHARIYEAASEPLLGRDEEAGLDAARADVVAPVADASVADARICSPQAPERRGGWVPAEVEQFAVACFRGYIALWCTAPSADAGLDAAADAADAAD
jgi:hypothetical protein